MISSLPFADGITLTEALDQATFTFEQSSEDVWRSVCGAVKEAVAGAGLAPPCIVLDVGATASIAVPVDRDGRVPESVREGAHNIHSHAYIRPPACCLSQIKYKIFDVNIHAESIFVENRMAWLPDLKYYELSPV